MKKLHPTALVSNHATIGENVEVGAFTIVHDNVSIGDNTIIENHCEIGVPTKSMSSGHDLVIGQNGHIRSHSIIYTGSEFGDNLITGNRVTIRENTVAQKNLQVGSLAEIQGHCSIGNFVRLHSNVHIGQHSKIDDFVWLFPYTVLTNDPHPPSDHFIGVHLERYAVISTSAVILPGITIGEGALVAASSLVTKNVAPDTLVAGNPAEFKCNTSRIKLRYNRKKCAYPWRRQFFRGYPTEIVSDWKAEFPDG
jgi:acetyltransferase-like isoleucine patch superfamily enzyme